MSARGDKKFLVVLAGATASGKTKMAIELARHYHTCIISADSRQFYKELNIGTAKPSEEELAQARHFFIGNKSVNELYGAGHFEKDAMKLLEELFSSHNLVIVAGGSGLYIEALLNGVDDFDEIPPELRENINSEYKQKGLEWLRQELREKDPVYFEKVDQNNPQRMIRGLEVIQYTQKPFSSFLENKKKARQFTPIKIMLDLERNRLYERINARVDKMMSVGLLEEVKNLADKKQFNALKTVGYRELYEYLEGQCSLDEAVEKIKQHTRNYAKRQITWFRNRDQFAVFDPENTGEIIKYIDKQIKEA